MSAWTPRSTPTTGKTRNTRNPATRNIWATSMDCERSPAWPSRSASSRRRRLTARAVSDSRTLAPSSATRLSAAARSRSSSTRISSPSAPSACHGVCPVIRALASASRIRHMDQPPPISLAAISASGTPRPPARFIPTRSRNAPTACRKSFLRCIGLLLHLDVRSSEKMTASTSPSQIGITNDTCTPSTAEQEQQDRPDQEAEDGQQHRWWPGSSRTTCSASARSLRRAGEFPALLGAERGQPVPSCG